MNEILEFFKEVQSHALLIIASVTSFLVAIKISLTKLGFTFKTKKGKAKELLKNDSRKATLEIAKTVKSIDKRLVRVEKKLDIVKRAGETHAKLNGLKEKEKKVVLSIYREYDKIK